MKKHPVLAEVEFDEHFNNSKLKEAPKEPLEEDYVIDIDYFYG